MSRYGQHQLPPSRRHPYLYAPFSPHGGSVKRDPDGDTLPQLHRPPSTGNAPDQSIQAVSGPLFGPYPPPPPPHQQQQQPQPPHMDDRRHMSFDSKPPPPLTYQQPSFPPPPARQYDAPCNYDPPVGGQESKYLADYGSTALTKRKAHRASQACDNCRQLKAKCDEQKPCTNCKEKDVDCKYRDPIPKQQEKVAADILEAISRLQATLANSTSKILKRMARLEHAIKRKQDNDEGETPYHMQESPAPTISDETYPNTPDDAMNEVMDEAARQATQALLNMESEEDSDEPPGSPAPPGKLSIAINHKAPAGLLRWPAIYKMVNHLLQSEGIKLADYPLRHEEQREPIRVHGRGEFLRGHDSPDAPLPEDTWGTVGGPFSPARSEPRAFATKSSVGAEPDLDPVTVQEYVSSYVENIQNMHPLIAPEDLKVYVNYFLLHYPHRTIYSALVLCILALGKVCLVKDRLADVIPGLDYFALASDIIAEHRGDASITNVYVNIVAGLYFDQLGWVIQSFDYIRKASQYMLTILSRRFRKFESSQDDNNISPKENKRIFAFWTCLQLESDIIAELALPQSGILAYEKYMPYPNESVAVKCGVDVMIFRSYLGQLYLRQHLNTIWLYGPDRVKPSRLDLSLMLYLGDELNQAEWTDDISRFTDDDKPSPELLHARLRATYWGARAITARPVIRAILNKGHTSVELPGMGEVMAEFQAESEACDTDDPRVMGLAKSGVKALIESTRAFHSIEDKRFIITNVFGTAHALWGNLITLAAVYRDPTISAFVGRLQLQDLFSKTINYFKIVAHESSALSIDMRILIGLQQELFSTTPYTGICTGSTNGSNYGTRKRQRADDDDEEEPAGGPRQPRGGSRRHAHYPPFP